MLLNSIMANDMATLKEQMSRLELAINEIDQDFQREVNPQYLKKLEKIKKQKGIRFKNTEEFDEYFLK